MDALKILLDGANRNRTLFVLLSAFALFPIYTGIADLPFWNDLAMRIMLPVSYTHLTLPTIYSV